MVYFGIYLYSSKQLDKIILDQFEIVLTKMFSGVENTTDHSSDWLFDIFLREQMNDFILGKSTTNERLSTKFSYVFLINHPPDELLVSISDDRKRDALLTKYEYLVRDKLQETGLTSVYGIELVPSNGGNDEVTHGHRIHSEGVYLIGLYIPTGHKGGYGHYHKYKKYKERYMSIDKMSY